MADPDKNDNVVAGVEQMRPGQVIAPGMTQTPAEQSPAAPKPLPLASTPPPAPEAEKPLPVEPPADKIPQTTFVQEGVLPIPSDGDVSWTASEFIAHEKSGGWYMRLALATLFVAGIIYLLTKDPISTAVIIVGAVALAIFAARKPRQLQYSLGPNGLSIGQKNYSYEAFRSFAVVPEGAFSSIVFVPLKRFAPLTTIYYAPQDEDKIIDLLSKRLPLEEHKLDAVDNLMHRIRF